MPKFVAYTDGAARVSNPGLAASSYVLYRDGQEIEAQAVTHPGLQTNNFAEYMGLLAFLILADKKHYRNVQIWCDSKLIVMQVNDSGWKVSPRLQNFSNTARALLIRGDHTLSHMRGHEKDPRIELHKGNNRADELCGEVLDKLQAKLKEENEKPTT